MSNNIILILLKFLVFSNINKLIDGTLLLRRYLTCLYFPYSLKSIIGIASLRLILCHVSERVTEEKGDQC